MHTCSTCSLFQPQPQTAAMLVLGLPIAGQCRRYPPSDHRREWGPGGIRTVRGYPRVEGMDEACGEYRTGDFGASTDGRNGPDPTGQNRV